MFAYSTMISFDEISFKPNFSAMQVKLKQMNELRNKNMKEN